MEDKLKLSLFKDELKGFLDIARSGRLELCEENCVKMEETYMGYVS